MSIKTHIIINVMPKSLNEVCIYAVQNINEIWMNRVYYLPIRMTIHLVGA